VAVTGDAMTGQPTALPTRKVASGGTVATMATLLIRLYDTCGFLGTPVPPETAAALTAMAAFAVPYAVPPARIETVLLDEDESTLPYFSERKKSPDTSGSNTYRTATCSGAGRSSVAAGGRRP
jgi:hypothetical protein